jgi:hypothetical protein
LVAISAAIAEVAANPAARTNDKATLFINGPFCYPSSVPKTFFLQPGTNSIPTTPRRIPPLKLREFFIFAAKQPRLKLHQMLPFYAFAGKLKNFQKRVAAKLHFLDAVSPLNALSAWNFERSGER